MISITVSPPIPQMVMSVGEKGAILSRPSESTVVILSERPYAEMFFAAAAKGPSAISAAMA